MIVEEIFDGGKGIYPYKYRVNYATSPVATFNDISIWANSTEFKCCIAGCSVYIRDEQDLSTFMLRWS